MSSFDNASREYKNELESIAADLIRTRGMPPWDALEEAKRIIRRRRQTPQVYDPMDILRRVEATNVKKS